MPAAHLSSSGVRRAVEQAEQGVQAQRLADGLGLDGVEVLGAGEHDDVDIAELRIVPELVEERPAVHARHLQVEEDEVGFVGAGDDEGVLPVARGEDAVALFVEDFTHDLDPLEIVVHDEDGGPTVHPRG